MHRRPTGATSTRTGTATGRAMSARTTGDFRATRVAASSAAASRTSGRPGTDRSPSSYVRSISEPPHQPKRRQGRETVDGLDLQDRLTVLIVVGDLKFDAAFVVLVKEVSDLEEERKLARILEGERPGDPCVEASIVAEPVGVARPRRHDRYRIRRGQSERGRRPPGVITACQAQFPLRRAPRQTGAEGMRLVPASVALHPRKLITSRRP